MSIVVKTHPLAEILAKKLFGIEGVPKAEQTKMVRRAIKAAVDFYDKNLQPKDSADGELNMCDYKANFLWPHDEESIEEAGFEFANGHVEDYQKLWWAELISRLAQQLNSPNSVQCPLCG